MNIENVNKLLQTYIDNFKFINNDEHKEYTKWIGFKTYKDNFDIDAENFAEMFKSAIKDVQWIADNSSKVPTGGIIKLASIDTAKNKVRERFRELYSGGRDEDVFTRQTRIQNFVDKINRLVAEHIGGWKMKQEFRTGLLYYTMMYPDNNYLYKPSEASMFRYCSEFGDDWGAGSSLRLSVYYKMCDQLLEIVNNTPDLCKIHQERLTENMLLDDANHLLVFDIIRNAYGYNWYTGIEIRKPVRRPSSTSKKAVAERQLNDLQAELNEKQNQLERYKRALEDLAEISVAGLDIRHKIYGKGAVIAQNNRQITIRFGETEKKFVLPEATALGLMQINDEDAEEYFETRKKLEENIKKSESEIKRLDWQISRLLEELQ